MKKSYLFFLCIVLFGLLGCEEQPLPETVYLVRTGGQASGSSHYEVGVFVSPSGSLVPYLIEDNSKTGSLSDVESLLSKLNFNQNWIQSVKNNLKSNSSAFVFYTNTDSYYRWIWITEN